MTKFPPFKEATHEENELVAVIHKKCNNPVGWIKSEEDCDLIIGGAICGRCSDRITSADLRLEVKKNNLQ